MSEVRVVQRRRSRIEVEKLVAEFEASGLRRDAFCQQRDLSVASLDKYRRRVHQVPRPSAASMVPVEMISSAPEQESGDAGGVLVIELRSGRRIEVHRGFDAATLERLLTVVDRA